MEGRERQIPTPQNDSEPTTPRYSEELDEHRSLKALVMLVQKVQCIKKKKKISQPEKYKGYSKKKQRTVPKKIKVLVSSPILSNEHVLVKMVSELG